MLRFRGTPFPILLFTFFRWASAAFGKSEFIGPSTQPRLKGQCCALVSALTSAGTTVLSCLIPTALPCLLERLTLMQLPYIYKVILALVVIATVIDAANVIDRRSTAGHNYCNTQAACGMSFDLEKCQYRQWSKER